MSHPLAQVVFLLAVAGSAAAAEPPRKRFVAPGPDGKLVYDLDARGNRVPNFSHCGYGGGGVAVPTAPARVVVPAKAGDSTTRIRIALGYVGGLPPDTNGVRGAVVLGGGRHEVFGQLRLPAGVVLRGDPGAVLVAAGTDRRTLIEIRGTPAPTTGPAAEVADAYVPVGATTLRLKSAAVKAGDRVFVEHRSTKAWISAVGMDKFPSKGSGSYLDWDPGTRDLRWDRAVAAADGDAITLDAPLTSALDASLSVARVRPYTWPGRVSHSGVEDLRIESAFDPDNPLDEQHAWNAVNIDAAEDVWVRRVTFAHFAGSAVAVWEGGRRVTVEDCESVKPVSEVGGHRRHTFATCGTQTLFRRCKATDGRHDFTTGHTAPGPNAFVECEAKNAHGFSGPLGSWASGVLYDNVTIDGGGLLLTNREIDDQGVGWAAANGVLWQCVAPVIACRTPPTAQNWSIGCWGQFVGDGHWREFNEFVNPDSLYDGQLADRVGKPAGRPAAPPAPPFVIVDDLPPEEWIKSVRGIPYKDKPLWIHNGWLVAGKTLVAGERGGTVWWRGQVLPATAASFGVGVTRFVPGRTGPGYTDDIHELTDAMVAKGQAVLDHHYGLWYDRRRDDHEMFRRIDGGVWPPFYEQPWARSGQGTAWDGLSKYDLTKFNPWYFDRLKQFADRGAEKGLILCQQMYFQHNVLEAGAHWADCPWRPANCLQETGFPEPPPYVGKKRIFFADEFYDVTHPIRRDMHRLYIRHCLDVLGECPNVIFQTSEEFTGPQEFVRFWLETIAEWEREKGRRVKVGLSCPKDVQDAVLADPTLAAGVSVIDLKYWWYTADGGVYDPKGGQNLAPRQFLREWKGPKNWSDVSTARMVRELRTRFPDKAVTCSFGEPNGWAVLAAGGSVPDLPRTTDPNLLTAAPGMTPLDGLPERQWGVAEAGRHYLVYSADGSPVRLDLPAGERFAATWIDPKTGATRHADAADGGYRPAGRGPAVLWVTRR
jgi:hypothetical protein